MLANKSPRLPLLPKVRPNLPQHGGVAQCAADCCITPLRILDDPPVVMAAGACTVKAATTLALRSDSPQEPVAVRSDGWPIGWRRGRDASSTKEVEFPWCSTEGLARIMLECVLQAHKIPGRPRAGPPARRVPSVPRMSLPWMDLAGLASPRG